MKDNLDALFTRATASHEAGRWQEAERDYRAILNVDADHPDALHQLGLLAYQNGKMDVAIDLVGRAIIRAPDKGSYHNTLGGALLESGRVETATAAFERALHRGPPSIEIRNNLANALHASGRLPEAISIYRAILADAPRDADVNNNLGRALEAAGDIDGALSCYRAARAVRPDDALILSHLCNALCARGAWDEAIDAGTKAEKLAPDSPVVLTNLGNALMGARRFTDAVGVYARAAEGADELPELFMNLGIAQHAAGNWLEAARCFEKVLESAVDDRARIALARTYASMGRLEDAVGLYRAALAVTPDDRETRLGLGLALNDLGRHAEGLREIEAGPGLARLVLGGPTDAADRRMMLSSAQTPNFIGSWRLKHPAICDRLIEFFEQNGPRHRQGQTSRGVDLSIKQATDFVIFPKDLTAPEYVPVAEYLGELEACLRDYAKQWPHLAEVVTSVDLVPFQIQRYKPGGHFQVPHSERMTFGLMHRVLAWMTYLNDVDDGGATRFHYYGLDVKPSRGKTLIWPAEWTHVHAGEVVNSGSKYIITGWMHFPHAKT